MPGRSMFGFALEHPVLKGRVFNPSDTADPYFDYEGEQMYQREEPSYAELALAPLRGIDEVSQLWQADPAHRAQLALGVIRALPSMVAQQADAFARVGQDVTGRPGGPYSSREDRVNTFMNVGLPLISKGMLDAGRYVVTRTVDPAGGFSVPYHLSHADMMLRHHARSALAAIRGGPGSGIAKVELQVLKDRNFRLYPENSPAQEALLDLLMKRTPDPRRAVNMVKDPKANMSRAGLEYIKQNYPDAAIIYHPDSKNYWMVGETAREEGALVDAGLTETNVMGRYNRKTLQNGTIADDTWDIGMNPGEEDMLRAFQDDLADDGGAGDIAQQVFSEQGGYGANTPMDLDARKLAGVLERLRIMQPYTIHQKFPLGEGHYGVIP
jgi:hypothetical protein